MQVVLVTFKPNGKQVNVPVKTETATIGRDRENTIRVPAASVSRKHCELEIDGERIRVTDLGSSNGTFVNGDRVKEVYLGPGDILTVGRVSFRLQIDGEPAEIEPFQPIGADEGAADAGGALVSEDAAAEAAPPETEPGSEPELLPIDDEDDEDFLAVFEPGAGDAGDSVGVSLDDSAIPGDDDPLSALEVFGDEAPDEPDKP